MKKNNTETLKLFLLLGGILVLGVGVAYAALSTTLTVTFGKVTQNAITWNVGFQGSSATGSSSGTSTTGLSCGSATITASAVTVADTTLSKPGDKCTWTLTIKNSGTVAANLGSITPTAPSSVSCTNSGASMVCGNITYKLTTNSGGSTLLTTSAGNLTAGSSLTVYLVAEYTGTTLNSSPVTQTGGKFTLVYNQA